MHVGLQVLEAQAHRGERRAQLVRRVGDERALRADELLEACRGGVERLGEHGELGGALRHLGARGEVAGSERPAASSRSCSGLVTERASSWLARNTMPSTTPPVAASSSQMCRIWSSIIEAGYVMRTAPWMPSTEPIGSAT